MASGTDVVCRFVRRARSAPDATAVEWSDGAITYADLLAGADRLADELRDAGIRAEDVVALVLDRSPLLVVAQLAVWRAGACFVVLDASAPTYRLNSLLRQSGAGAVVAVSGSRPDIDHPTILRVGPPSPAAGRAAPVEPRQRRCPHPDQGAYVVYTSGSTGAPKGVHIPHRGLAGLVDWHESAFGLSAQDRTALIASPAFDASVWEIWPTLCAGAVLTVPDSDVRDSLTRLRDWLVRRSVTVCFAPTPMAEGLIELEWPSGTAMRLLLTGGDRLTRFPPADLPFRLVNNYGPSECTVVATSGTVTVPSAGEDLPDIGSAVGRTVLHVLDERLNPVRDTEAGELFIGGPGVARGYLGRPDLTAGRFLPDPTGTAPGARLYRTGDLVRRREDGRLEFLGRTDHQVKVRGFRIELGEIEACLLGHSLVQSAVVQVAGSGPWAGELIAHVVTAPETDLPASRLEEVLGEHLRTRLPAYMVPRALVRMPAFPLTSQGKIDRRALPLPESGPRQDRELTPPRTERERIVSDVFQRHLGGRTIGVHDDFLALGGQSLVAMRIAVELESLLEVPVAPRTVFDNPTVAALAEALDTAGPAPSASVPVPTATPDPLPLSDAQTRVWFMEKMAPGSAQYVVPLAFVVTGTLRPEVLERALDILVLRHEPLHSRVTDDGSGPKTWREPHLRVPLRRVDLSGCAEHVRRARLETLRRESALPFEPGSAPMLRCTLVRLGESHHELLIAVHHIAFDGWSVRVLMSELAAACTALAEGRTPVLPELHVRHSDITMWQRSPGQAERLTSQLDHWRAVFATPPPALELPADRPRKDAAARPGSKMRQPLRPELLQAVRTLSGDVGVTPFVVFFTAYQLLLHRYSGQTDITTGVPLAQRSTPECRPLIGMMTNTLPLRVDLGGDPTSIELLHQVRRTVMFAAEHGQVPLERIVSAVDVERDAVTNPLFQTLFVYQEPVPAVDGHGLRIAYEGELDNGCAKFDLSLYIDFPESGPALIAEYDTDLFDAVTVERLLDHYQTLLGSLTREPGDRVSRLPLLAPGSGDAASVRGPETEAPPLPLHTLFERQAAATPDAPAVEHGEAALTYRELDEQANRLAHHLRRLGAGPSTPVAVCLERSLDLPRAVLAILKAGAAYVPLDPDYPPPRLAAALTESAAPLVVTRRSERERIPAGEHRVVCLDEDAPSIAREPASAPRSGATAADLAYVLFTSGSTGTPKGVAMPHRAVSNLIDWQRTAGELGSATRTLQYSSLSFDVSCQELFSTWAVGGTLVLVDDHVRRDSGELLRFLRRHRIERVFLPFVALHHLAEAWEPGIPLRLREVVTAGEQLRITPQMRGFFAALPGSSLHNHYGPSETHVVTAHILRGSPAHWPDIPPIGRPVSAVTARALDDAMRPVPHGVPGELWLGGPCLADGYLNRPELTAERFLALSTGERLYRTGDRVRILRDGTIEFLGRTDDQVKIRGHRVEPAEVEAALSRLDDVRAVAVAARGGDGAQYLCAYVVPQHPVHEDDRRRLADRYRDELSGRLPDYLVPQAFVLLDALPLTPSGKVDRRALPEPEPLRGGAASSPPRDALETVIAQAWADTLKLDGVGREDHFFRLGGHSLVATRITSHLREALGVAVALRTLFLNPTLAAFARALREQHGTDIDLAAEEYLLITGLSDDEAEAMLQAALSGNEHEDSTE
ncbi:non-ribosomal peptide synthetase [Streptomyces sp. H51]|uniref:non-ribosomal peptide synthetase n=1 Tax=Streptomyces sp. H51 TaxID=3111770 RepID=UPI002D765AEA|nr:non-ribosomal peptide synthetase [Streptomyces sp. H51]